MTIELALTPDSRWGLDGPALATIAGDAGFGAVGLPLAKADDATAATLAAKGLRCHELLALVLSRNEQATLRRAEALAEAADAVRAEWVLTTFGAPLTGGSSRTIARCAAMFAEVGAKMAVEFSPLGTVPTIPAALGVVGMVGADRAGILIDTWHFFRGDSTWGDLEGVPLELIAYVQFDDAPEAVSDDPLQETMNRRLLPGRGTFDLDRFVTTLLERGWQGLVSVEVLNQALPGGSVPEFARAAYETTDRYWR